MGLLAELHSVTKAHESLEELMVSMCRYGQPKLSMLDSGWNCWIQMRVQSAGASFEIRSEFGHKEPIAAAKECADRIAETLAKIGSAAR